MVTVKTKAELSQFADLNRDAGECHGIKGQTVLEQGIFLFIIVGVVVVIVVVIEGHVKSQEFDWTLYVSVAV